MKQIRTALKSTAPVALAMVLVSCASELQEHKRIAFSAGFKVINPVKPDQVALLPTLPKDQVTPITYHGKTYFILPDAENNQAFVGGLTEFRSYQLLMAKEAREAKAEAAQMDQMAAYNQMNWGAWGGWSAVGAYPRVGRYGLR